MPVTAWRGVPLTPRQRQIGYWLALLLLAAGTAIAASKWTADRDSARQFHQSLDSCFAEECLGSDIGAVSETVTGTGETIAKNRSYWLDLSGSGGNPQRVTFTDDHGVWSAVKPGDAVNVLYWRGLAVSVTTSDGAVSSTTSDDPDENSRNVYLTLLLLATVLLVMTVSPAIERARNAGGMRRLVVVWVIALGYLYAAWVIAVKQSGSLIPLFSFAVIAVVSYPATVLIERRELKRWETAVRNPRRARPTRIP